LLLNSLVSSKKKDNGLQIIEKYLQTVANRFPIPNKNLLNPANKMNRTLPLRRVLDKLKYDDRLDTRHVAVYYTLVEIWNARNQRSPFAVNEGLLREAGKIHSTNAVEQCLRELDDWGYILYFFRQQAGQESKVSLCDENGNAFRKTQKKRKPQPTVLPEVIRKADVWPELGDSSSRQAVWVRLAQVVAQAAIQLLLAHLDKHLHLF